MQLFIFYYFKELQLEIVAAYENRNDFLSDISRVISPSFVQVRDVMTMICSLQYSLMSSFSPQLNFLHMKDACSNFKLIRGSSV